MSNTTPNNNNNNTQFKVFIQSDTPLEKNNTNTNDTYIPGKHLSSIRPTTSFKQINSSKNFVMNRPGSVIINRSKTMGLKTSINSIPSPTKKNTSINDISSIGENRTPKEYSPEMKEKSPLIIPFKSRSHSQNQATISNYIPGQTPKSPPFRRQFFSNKNNILGSQHSSSISVTPDPKIHFHDEKFYQNNNDGDHDDNGNGDGDNEMNRDNQNTNIKRLDSMKLESNGLDQETKNLKKNQGKDDGENNNVNEEVLMEEDEKVGNEIKKIIQDLTVIQEKSKNDLTELQNKISQIQQILSPIEEENIKDFKKNELKNIKDTILILCQDLLTLTKPEINSENKANDIEVLKLKLTKIYKKHKKLKENFLLVNKEMHKLKEHIKNDKEEDMDLAQEKLKKNIELMIDDNILDHEIRLKLKKMYIEILKENDNFKEKLYIKDKEYDKLYDINIKLKYKLSKTKKILQNIKINKSSYLLDNLNNNNNDNQYDDYIDLYKNNNRYNNNHYNNINDNKTFFESNKLPKSIEFRMEALKKECACLLTDIIYNGSMAFTQHIIYIGNIEEQKAAVHLITSQFLSYRTFAEKYHYLINTLLYLTTLKSVENLMSDISLNMRSVVSAENVNLWLNDSFNGLMYTYTYTKKLLKCSINKGLFGELIKHRKTIAKYNENKTKFLLYEYQDSESPKTYKEETLNAILVPLLNEKGMIYGVLEISKFSKSHETLDQEYFALVLARICGYLSKNLIREIRFNQEIKYTELLYEAFLDLIKSQSYYEFVLKVEKWMSNIFISSQGKFIFVQNDKIIIFKKDGSSVFYDVFAGIAGKSITTNKTIVTLDTLTCTYYSENVDMKSSLPILTKPIFERITPHKKPIGVIQISIKNRLQISDYKLDEVYERHIKSSNANFEANVSKFGDFVSNAFSIVEFRLK